MKSLFLVLLLCFVIPCANAREWNRFRGPDGQGISDAKSLPATFQEEQLAWKVELPGKGPSSPVFWKDKLYLTVSGDAGARGVVCLDAATGKEQWVRNYTFETYRHHKHNDYASSSPCVDDQGVYITWTDAEKREVLSLDHQGKDRWRVDLGRYFVNHGSGGSPIVVGDIVIVVNDVELEEKGHRFLVGLNREDGSEVWRTELKIGGKAGFYTPAVFTPEKGEPQIVGACTSEGVFGLDPKSGKKLWSVGSFSYRTVATPVVVGDKIFVTAGSGGGGKESALVTPGTEANEFKAKANTSLRKNLPYVVSPVAADGLLYLWSDRGILTVIKEERFPKQTYSERIGDRMNFYASPVLADGKLYGVSREGQLVVLKVGDTFEKLGTTDLGERSDATPAVHGGKLYLRTNTHVMCLPPLGGK